MKIIHVANKDMERILSLSKDEFLQHVDEVKIWLKNNYPQFETLLLTTTQHGGETMLDHVTNFLCCVNTDGYSSQEIYNLRLSIVHHDIDRLLKEESGKRSNMAANIWKDYFPENLSLENVDENQIELLIRNHDIFGYFWSTFRKGMNAGISPKEMWEIWIKKHPNVNNLKLLNMLLRVNIADNESGGGLKQNTKNKRRKNLEELYSYLEKGMNS